MQTLVYDAQGIDYDGTQLAPHYLYRKFDLLGDALVAFQGAARVDLDHMVDLADVKSKAPIYSPRMLHFLAEWFIDSLEQGILLQHVFVATAYELLLEDSVQCLRRRGNDLYFQDRKLNVSIATRSPVSVLMHTAFNVETEGTPVPTASLAELPQDPWDFARRLLVRFEEDRRWRTTARVKVLPR